MADGQIKIIVGAALGRSVESTFGSIEKMAERTGRQVAKALGAGTGGTAGGTAALGRGFRAAAAEADKSSKEIERSFAKQVKAAEKASKEEYSAFQKASLARTRLAEKEARDRARLAAAIEREQDRFLRQETRNVEREAAKRERAEAKSAAKIDSQRRQFAERVSHRSVRFLFPNPIGAFGMASRIGSDLLHGAGVDFSMAGMAHRAVQAQEVATNLSNQGYMSKEAGPNSTRVAASVLEAEARKNAQTHGYTTEQTLSAQTKFVDITGNLDDSRKSMGNILKLSGASNTDPEKMAEAWANVSRHIGDVPNKAQKVYGLMKLIAGQGRVGSDEIKYMAPNLAKIAAMADKYGGDRATSIGHLTTISQMAKAEGGAATSREAATSIVSFTNTFSSAARVKAMMAAGLKEEDIFQMQGKGKDRVRTHIQDPFEIIKKVLIATGGDIGKFGGIFKSVMSQRATNSIVAAYNSGGGRNMAAVDKQIDKFGSEAALSEEDVNAAQANRLGTAAVQAKIFQEQLDEVGKNVEAELLPALRELAPYALEAAKGLGQIVTFAARNPLEAVGVAIGAAIARAGLEATFRAGIEKALTGTMAQGLTLTAPLAITAAVATIAVLAMNKDIEDREKAQNEASNKDANAGSLWGREKANARKGFVTSEDQNAIATRQTSLMGRIKRAETIGDFDKANGGAPTSDTGIAIENLVHPERNEARMDRSHIEVLKAELADHRRVLEMIRTGTLRVVVTNPEEIGGNGPRVFAPGRELDAGHLPAYLRR